MIRRPPRSTRTDTLFPYTTPFRSQDPGYIRGYVPGVRENGGQYTHAAVWATMAFAELGDHARAWDLFRMINPIHHGDTAERIATYKVEPYRSEELRVGKECVSTVRSRWSLYY